MKISQHVQYSIDDYESSKLHSAMLHACVAIDGTAAKFYGKSVGNRNRYVNFLRNYYWLIEPMLGWGINLDDTRFENIKLSQGNGSDRVVR